MTAIKQDGPYDSRTLTKVFFGSSLALAATIVWMVGDDWTHQWRGYQRDFLTIQRKKAMADLEEAKRTAAPLQKQLEEAVAAAREQVKQREDQVKDANKDLDKAQAQKEAADIKFAVAKSYVDSYVYFDEETGANKNLTEHTEYAKLLAEAFDKQDEQQKEKEQTTAGVSAAKTRIESLEKPLIDAKKALEDSLAAVSKNQRAYDKIGPGFRNDWLRNEPGVDFLDPTEKPQKQVIDNLKWQDFYFAQVRTVDFCQSCHKGIDQRGFEGSIVSVPGAANVAVSKVADDGKGGVDVTLPSGHVDHLKTSDLVERVDVEPVFHSHPNLDLYLTAASPHPVERFGCTPCHLGEGDSITFKTASHIPNTEAQRAEWGEKYKWEEREHWNFPQFATRYVQASCLLCHPNNRPVPGADKLNFGRETWERLSCVGCHKMKGFEEEAKRGPDLRRMEKKLSKDWVAYWIENPQRFRPKTNMPRFFNGDGCALVAPTKDEKDDAKKQDADKAKRLYDYDVRESVEVKAIVRFLWDRSQSFVKDAGTDDPFLLPNLENKKGSAARGKVLFTARGCVGCHRIEPTANEDTALRSYAPDEFGPNLYNLAHKLDPKTGRAWIWAWVANPRHYWAETRMPELRIDVNDGLDIATYLHDGDDVKDASLADMKPEGWVDQPLDGQKGEPVQLEYALRDYLDKDYTQVEVDAILKGNQVRQQAGLPDETARLMYLGEQTVSRLGCFGCHFIKGMESRPGIGRDLSDIGDKNLTQVDWGFESVSRFMDVKEKAEKAGGKIRENRQEWLDRKIELPRCFDRGKVKGPLDRSRMPQFKTTPFERDALVTYLLGQTGNRRVPDEYKYKPSVRRSNMIEGEYAILRNNCKACHLFGVDRVAVATKDGVARQPILDPKTGAPMKSPLTGAPIEGRVWVDGHLILDNMKAYGVENGGAVLQVYASTPTLGKDDQGSPITKDVGELVSVCADATLRTIDDVRSPITGADADLLRVIELTPDDVWGQDIKARDAAKAAQTAAIKKSLAWRNRGGTSLEKIIEARTTEKAGSDAWLPPSSPEKQKDFDLDKVRGPIEDSKTYGAPHLIGEGKKIQPLWLQSFLKEPTEIRPNLRAMPDWNNDRSIATYEKAGGTHMPTYGFTDAGTQVFSRYFAAQDEDVRINQARPLLEAIQAKVKAKTPGFQARRDIQQLVYPTLDKLQVREYFNVVIVDGVFNYYPRGDVSLSRALDEKTDPYYAAKESKTPGWYSDGYRFFEHKEANCQGCHMVKGRTPTGTPESWAPDLGRVRERLRPAFLQEWIDSPKSIIPGTKMTKVFLDGKFQDILTGPASLQISSLVDWLMAGAPAVLDAYPATLSPGQEVRLTSEIIALDGASVEVQENGTWRTLKEDEFTREKSLARVAAISVKIAKAGSYLVRVKDRTFTAVAEVNVQ